jgi:hypothetical protein
MTRTSPDDSPFVVLWRTFVAQFFTSESVTSDDDLHRMIIGIVAFLLPPVLFLMVSVFPTHQVVVLVARTRNMPWLIEEMHAWLAFILVTYSMVTVGFIAVCAWEALSFNRRDAMVLGPLPLRGTTIVAAKLAALGALLLGTSIAVNALNALAFFATTTSNPFVERALARYIISPMVATVAAATFAFAAIVTIRGALSLLGGVRLMAAMGSLLQFLFVVALLCFVILIAQSHTSRPAFLESGAAWNPAIWFGGWVERLRGSPSPEWIPLARRALLGTAIAVTGAATVAVFGFRRQMQLALTPSARTGPVGAAILSRTLARWIVGGNAVARATSDFILLTIARNRQQQGLIAINVAVGVAICLAGLSRNTPDLASLMRPRTAVLWIPLVIAYWGAIGMRASFFVPSELPASWSFRASAPEPTSAYWSAVRASMIAAVAPATLAITLLLLVPLLGWRIAMWHSVVVSSLILLLAELLALTIPFVPFTRTYQPGHANLKTRWPLYAIGLYGFAYVPARLEIGMLGNRDALLWMVASIVAAIVVLEIVGRSRSRKWSATGDDASVYRWDETALDIGRVARAQR